MKLEQFQESEGAPNAKSEEVENFENSIEARSKTASLFLSALINAESYADLNKIIEPENKTDIINIREKMQRNFEKGVARFYLSAPFEIEEDGRKISTNISVVSVENNNPDKTISANLGARFIMRQKAGSAETEIVVSPFSDLQNTAENPYIMTSAINELADTEKDRYLMLVTNLNLYTDILRALKLLGEDETMESRATLAKINEFIGVLDEEYPNKYNKEPIKEILQN